MYRNWLILLFPALFLAACRSLGDVATVNGDFSSTSVHSTSLPQPSPPPSLAIPSLLPYLPPSSVVLYPALTTLPPSPSPSITNPGTGSPSPTPATFTCLPESFSPEYALVLWVVDGNTIVVDLQGRRQAVRYLGIAAPRLFSPAQPYGEQAKQTNQLLVAGQVVRLLRDVSDSDRFGQLLRHVLVGDTYINYEIVRRGLAQAQPSPPDLACQELLAEAQRRAEIAQSGLWSLPTPSRTSAPPASVTPTFTITPNLGTATFTPTNTLTRTNTPTGTITPPTPTGTLTPPTPTSTSVIVLPTSTLTRSPTPSPTITSSPTEMPDMVYIETIHYIDSSSHESGEYVQIRNGSASMVLIYGWVLRNDDTGAQFTFPNTYISVGQAYRVYTNNGEDTGTGGFSFNSSTPIWDNTHGCASLYDTSQRVDRYCYP